LLLPSVASGESQSPWWHLTLGAQPTSIAPGSALDEVQELTVKKGAGVYVIIREEHERVLGIAVVSETATATQLREALEGPYGKGNVEVSGSPGGASGSSPYEITFVAELADQRIAPMVLFGSEVEVAQVREGMPDGKLMILAGNLGDADANGEASPVSIVDRVPAGLKAVAIEGRFATQPHATELECSVQTVTCRFDGVLPPGEQLEVFVSVVAEHQPQEANEATVSGGGAAAARALRAVPVGGEPKFGVETYELSNEEEGGAVDAQGGSHPFQTTSTIVFNQGRGPAHPPAPPKDLHVKLPAGLVGNVTEVPQCTGPQFYTSPEHDIDTNECPPDTVVGEITIRIVIAGHGETPVNVLTVPVFNLKPNVGEPARFGFDVLGVKTVLDFGVRSGEDYGIDVDVSNIPELINFLSSTLTLWGTPGAPSHNGQRGWSCVDDEYWHRSYPPVPACTPEANTNRRPLITLPTLCDGSSRTTVEADSWQQPGVFTEPLVVFMPAQVGCGQLPFTPAIEVAPDVQSASTSTGLRVNVHVPQEVNENGGGLTASSVKGITVALPAGVQVNPSDANGLEACTEGMVGFKGDRELNPEGEPGDGTPVFTATLPEPLSPGLSLGAEGFCPNAAKIADVTIHTPLLVNPLAGSLYLASENANPFGSLLAMYLVAEDPVSGTLVKIPGVARLCQGAGEMIEGFSCQAPGQIISTFAPNPQVPFEDATIEFFGGERAPLATPARCGTYTTRALFTPWSGAPPATSTSSFQITSGPNGGPCPGASLRFAPTLTGGATNVAAGNFTPFTMTMSREDGQQPLQGVQLHLPPGLLGMLSSVTPCEEAQANAGACGAASKIGETTVSVGVGGTPYTVQGGGVYITGPYHGAPYGLAIEEPAKAGPFDLENTTAHHPACDCLVVRARIEVDPVTSALTVTANSGSEEDSIPTMLEGIPLEIKHVNVTINRPGFTFNPTDCNPLAITGTLSSAEGAIFSPQPVHFQVTNCGALAFKAKFAASTKAHNTRTAGASLTTTVTYPNTGQGTEANIAKVKVSLPARLPARLSTLQKACPEATFAANPAGCPAASKIGTATTTTPVLPEPLSGPAYFVSHGGAAYPELVIVLQGDNVTIDLHGNTAISKKGVLTSTFNTVPDAPFSKFELTLPEGSYSALTANGAHLCKFGALHMPTELTAQDGAVIKQDTKVTIAGCPKKKVVKHKAKKGQR
jgi:hypothetical protein